jgi:hypothetical protein
MDFQSISAGIAGIAGFPRALYARGKYFFGGWGKNVFFPYVGGRNETGKAGDTGNYLPSSAPQWTW